MPWLERESLKDLVNRPGIERLDALLLCLAVKHDTPLPVKEIRALATSAGLRPAKKWNISSILGRSQGLAVRTSGGWELSTAGTARVRTLAGPLIASPTVSVAVKLRAEIARMKEPNSVRFVEEAVSSFESGFLRAAVVLSWIGAVSVLYEHVLAVSLPAFNLEARRRNPKWRTAKTRDDLARLREHDFLAILEAISTIGKSVSKNWKGVSDFVMAAVTRTASKSANTGLLGISRFSSSTFSQSSEFGDLTPCHSTAPDDWRRR